MKNETYLKAKEFADKYIRPHATEIDEKEEFPREIFDKIGEAGYYGLLIPENMGGMGGTLKDHADVTRAFTEACGTVGVSYMMHNVAINCVLESNEEMKNEVIKEVVDNKAMCALCFSETGTGVHQVPEIQAKFLEKEVIFNGKKAFVTCAEYAKYYLSNVTSEDGKDADNWLIPVPSEGISFDMSEWHGIGMTGNASCPMYLKDVKVDKKYRTNEDGKGLAQAVGTCMPFFLTGLACVSAGLSTAILEEAIRHSKERKYSSGQALCQIETIQHQLSLIYSSTNAIIANIYEAVRAHEAGDEDSFVKILSARLYASDTVLENAKLGMRIGGGLAYNKQTCMERLLRDSYAGHIMSPSYNVLALWIGRIITGQPMA